MIILKAYLKMNNKNGKIGMDEVVKIIISVVIILILAGLAYSLYRITREKETDQAKAVLEQVADKVNTMKQGSELITITGPRNWYLFSDPGVLCVCSDVKSKCPMQNRTCISLSGGLKVTIPDEQISIYVSDIILNKENENVYITVKR